MFHAPRDYLDKLELAAVRLMNNSSKGPILGKAEGFICVQT